MVSKYYLGHDIHGERYYLEAESWDCDWYWGFGYITSKNSHQHADGHFYSENDTYNDGNIFTGGFLVKKTFTDKQGWELRELMSQFYTFRKMADLYHTGGAHIGGGTLGQQWKDPAKAEHINKDVLPVIFKQIKTILTEEKRS